MISRTVPKRVSFASFAHYKPVLGLLQNSVAEVRKYFRSVRSGPTKSLDGLSASRTCARRGPDTGFWETVETTGKLRQSLDSRI